MRVTRAREGGSDPGAAVRGLHPPDQAEPPQGSVLLRPDRVRADVIEERD